jgi:hypothetical protein
MLLALRMAIFASDVHPVHRPGIPCLLPVSQFVTGAPCGGATVGAACLRFDGTGPGLGDAGQDADVAGRVDADGALVQSIEPRR